MMLADAHLHLFRRGFPGVYGRSLLGPEVDVYESLRARHGIAAGLVIGYQGEGIDPDNNAYIRSLAADRPWMATLAHVDARAIPTAQALRTLLDGGHAGIALYILEPADAEALGAWPASAWQLLHDRRAMISANVPPEFVGTFGPVAARSAGCTFLISHLGLPGAYARPPGAEAAAERLAPLTRMATLPNILVKISAPYAVSDPSYAYPHQAAAPFVDLVLDRFGPERCVWGSDFSPALDHVSFAQTIASPWLDGLAEGERASVMGGNLSRLLGRAQEPG